MPVVNENKQQQKAASLSEMDNLLKQSQQANTNASQQQTNQPKQQYQPQGNPAMNNQRNYNEEWSWLSPQSLSTVGQGFMPSSEKVSRIIQAIRAAHEQMNTQVKFGFDVLAIDRESVNDMQVSYITVCFSGGQDVSYPVAYHVIAVLDTFDGPFMDTVNIMNQTAERLYVAAEFFNGRINDLILERVRSTFPGRDIRYAEMSQLPKDFDYRDNGTLTRAVLNAVRAAATALDIVNGVKMNLKNNAQDAAVAMQVQSNVTDLTDSYDEPIAANFLIVTNAQGHRQMNQAIPSEHVTLVRSAATLDLLYNAHSAAAPINQPFSWAPQQQQKPIFTANLIFQDVVPLRLATREAWLWALFTSCVVSQTSWWVNEFRPNRSVDANPCTDLSFIGYELRPEGVYDRIDVAKMTEEQFNQFLAMTLSPGLAVSLDIQDAGAHTWMNSFIEAAANNPDPIIRNDAKKNIVRDLNTLTGGHFTNCYQARLKEMDPSIADDYVESVMRDGSGKYAFSDANLFSNLNGNRIHVGYYFDAQGKRQSLAKVGTAMVGNILAPNDQTAIQAWTETFNDSQVPVNLRLSERWKLINNMVNNPTLTGYGSRINIESATILAVLDAFIKVGFKIQPNSRIIESAGRTRSDANYIDAALMQQRLQTGIFNTTTAGGAHAFQGRFNGGFSNGYNV